MSEAQMAEIERSRAQARLSAEKFERVYAATEPKPMPQAPRGPGPESVKTKAFTYTPSGKRTYVGTVVRNPPSQRQMTAKQKKFFRPRQERQRRPGRPFTLKSLGGSGYYSPGPKSQRRRVGISGRTTTVIPGRDGEELLHLRKRAQIIEEKKELARLRKNDRFFYRQHPYYLSEAERLA